jgi:hypothetical protein
MTLLRYAGTGAFDVEDGARFITGSAAFHVETADAGHLHVRQSRDRTMTIRRHDSECGLARQRKARDNIARDSHSAELFARLKTKEAVSHAPLFWASVPQHSEVSRFIDIFAGNRVS